MYIYDYRMALNGQTSYLLPEPTATHIARTQLPIHTMNPYGQQWQQGGAAPSIFGALPSLPVSHAPRAMQSDSIMFSFTDFKTTILNCTVVGPQGRTAYRIITEPAQPACTIVKDNESKSVAMIQWQPAASLEVRGVTNRQRVRDWLRLSPDQRYASATVCLET